MEGVEISHDPIVVNLNFLEMKLAVVGVELQLKVVVLILFVALLNETKNVAIVVLLDAEGYDLVDGQSD